MSPQDGGVLPRMGAMKSQTEAGPKFDRNKALLQALQMLHSSSHTLLANASASNTDGSQWSYQAGPRLSHAEALLKVMQWQP
eukprot:scaffold75684_cov20-Tisochrysis_lutea.AAC.2